MFIYLTTRRRRQGNAIGFLQQSVKNLQQNAKNACVMIDY